MTAGAGVVLIASLIVSAPLGVVAGSGARVAGVAARDYAVLPSGLN